MSEVKGGGAKTQSPLQLFLPLSQIFLFKVKLKFKFKDLFNY